MYLGFEFHDFIFIKDKGSMVRINFNDLQYVESIGNYVKIFSGKKFYVSHITMREMETLLPTKLFIRTHRSFIVNLSHVSSISDNDIHVGDARLAVGKTYKDNLRTRLTII